MHAVDVVQQNENDTRWLITPLIADWITLANRMQRLSWDVLGDASQVNDADGAPRSQLAAHYLCARIIDELRAVMALSTGGYVIPALSLDAGMLEYAFAVGWIGKHVDRGEKWLTWMDEKLTPFGSVYDAIEATFKNGGRSYSKAQVKVGARQYESARSNRCAISWGRQHDEFGVDMDDRGRPERFPQDQLSPLFVYSSRRAPGGTPFDAGMARDHMPTQ